MEDRCSELLRVQLRWMTEDDLDEVYALEQSRPHPWTPLEFVEVLRRPDTTGLVVEYQKMVVGFIVYQQTDGAIDICNMLVKDEFRRKGVGSQMVARVACRLDRARHRQISLQVRETDLVAQLFFRSLGFRAVSITHSSYDSGEDAYTMQYRHRAKVLPTEMVMGYSE